MKMFNIPNLLTASNMLCGVIAILLTVAGYTFAAPFFIFLAAILDFFDGFLARLLKQQGELGKQLDSLADMISFGLAPGIMMVAMLISASGTGDIAGNGTMNVTAEQVEAGMNSVFGHWVHNLVNGEHTNWLPLCGLIIPFFSMFRLAKFNIDTRQSESFIGLPTPANTIFFMAFPLLQATVYNSSGLTWESELLTWLMQPAVLIAIIVIMSLLLVAELPLFALKFKKFGWKGNEIRYAFLVGCVLLIVLIRFWAIPIIIILYLLLSVANNYTSKKQHS